MEIDSVLLLGMDEFDLDALLAGVRPDGILWPRCFRPVAVLLQQLLGQPLPFLDLDRGVDDIAAAAAASLGTQLKGAVGLGADHIATDLVQLPLRTLRRRWRRCSRRRRSVASHLTRRRQSFLAFYFFCDLI